MWNEVEHICAGCSIENLLAYFEMGQKAFCKREFVSGPLGKDKAEWG